jgi:hypothetical protein
MSFGFHKKNSKVPNVWSPHRRSPPSHSTLGTSAVALRCARFPSASPPLISSIIRFHLECDCLEVIS